MWRELFATVAQLLVASPMAWKDLERENRNRTDYLNRFLYPLFGLIALAAFVGGLWFTRDGDLENALKKSIISMVAVFGAYVIISYILNEIAERFALKQNLFLFQQFTGYASVVMYLLYCLIPFMSDFFILWLLALYSIHQVHMGAIYFFKVPAHKRGAFIITASALVILVPAFIHALFSFFIQ
ncbi:MAG TPA: YIP1 family protein [Proteiniphilum sp.]|nr:YIP1 family protein [Proteiniphilum sp.]HPJ49663.1 YIP1 family protein [Proteiniphilum sp.]HPR20725.1 YIP1 family protein [Proteiniphilum sp.]